VAGSLEKLVAARRGGHPAPPLRELLVLDIFTCRSNKKAAGVLPAAFFGNKKGPWAFWSCPRSFGSVQFLPVAQATPWDWPATTMNSV
jgi:hypothetical protein